jgi:hypothetical protein
VSLKFKRAIQVSGLQMEQSRELLELLNTLIITAQDNTVILNKETLQSVLTCLQVTEAKVRLLQYQSQLLNDELIDLKNQQPVKCSELVFVQNNPLYDDDDDTLVRQLHMQMKMKAFLNLHFKSFLLSLVKKIFQ